MSETAASIEVVHRTCPLCEAHCGISVEVERDGSGRGGTVKTVRGDDEDSFSRGYICPKAYALKGLHEDPNRIRKPLRRIRRNGEPARGLEDFEEISWAEALDEAAAGLRRVRDEHGVQALANYFGNPNAHDMGSIFYNPLFVRALGTKRRFSASSLDQLPKMVSSQLLFGGALTVPIPDVDRTDYFLVLGANPLASNGSLMTAPDMPGRLRALRERGGRLVVVDPRRSETAEIADEHVFLRPGTDAFFLFAMVNVLFEEGLVALGRLAEFTQGVEAVATLAKEFTPEAVAAKTGVDAERIRRITREFARARSAVCYGRIGTCTQEFGTLSSWLVDVVNALTGNLDRPGGAMFPKTAHGPAFDKPKRSQRVPYARFKSTVRELPEFGGELPAATMAEEIDSAGEDRIRAVVTVAGNPVLSSPNGERLAKAFESLDFMVSIDIYLNETTRHANLILPTGSQLERSNYDAAFHQLAIRNTAKYSPAVFRREDPRDPTTSADGTLDPWEVLLELAARLGDTTPEALDELLFSGLLGMTVGAPGTACPDTTADEAREQLAHRIGPERMLDLMLRAGPYGDRFGANPGGLSLQKLVDEPHGVDLGALEPRLPELIGVEDGVLELAPDLLVGDVPRLSAALARDDGDGLVLVGRRQLRSNNSWMHNVHALAKGRDRCTLLVNPEDGRRLGLENGARARVRSRVGEVEAPVELSDEMMPGVVSIPHGFGHDLPGVALDVARAKQPGVNSNLLTDEDAVDVLSGNAVLNGIPVEVARA